MEFTVRISTDNEDAAEIIADYFHDSSRKVEEEQNGEEPGVTYDALEEARSVLYGAYEDLSGQYGIARQRA